MSLPRVEHNRGHLFVMRTILCNVVLCSFWLFGPVDRCMGQPEESRRDYYTPGLMVETGFRMGSCDVLTFTDTGQDLLAAGDDKVVRSWAFTGDALKETNRKPLRWKSWQESRGQIYALALSPDKQNRFVAVGGKGLTQSQVAVIERLTGKIENAIISLDDEHHGAIWSLDFSPDGEQLAIGAEDGTVWMWSFQTCQKPKKLGRHPGKEGFNYVRLVKYVGGNQLLSVAENYSVRIWDTANPGASTDVPLPPALQGGTIYRAAITEMDNLLALHVFIPGQVHTILLHSLKNQANDQIHMPHGVSPQCLAFDSAGTRLAVGVRQFALENESDFEKNVGGKVLIVDLRAKPLKLRDGPTNIVYPQGVAFHPDGDYLAVAGYEHHDVTLWDLRKPFREAHNPVSNLRGPGSGIWSVTLLDRVGAFSAAATTGLLGVLKAHGPFPAAAALSPTERTSYYLLGFQQRRHPNPPGPNQRGTGKMRVFDFNTMNWATGTAIEPPEPMRSYQGWEVITHRKIKQPGGGTAKDFSTWFVKTPNGQLQPIEIDNKRFDFPRCYVFIPPKGAKPLRLAVGHYWGVSIFELSENHKPRLAKILTGHEGEVMCLAVSENQRLMVTGSRDQTIAGWSLEGWPSHPELGARFLVRDGKLLVDQVDAGSPAWEAGISPDDQIVVLVVGGNNIVFDRHQKYCKGKNKTAHLNNALDYLRDAQAGKELYFEWRRKRENNKGFKEIKQLTTVRQRPLWKFFPTRDGEWVLWRWRDYYYTCSTKGDSSIGFQQNGETVQETPKFHKVEQFREYYHQPAKIKEMMTVGLTDPKFVRFPDIAPPGQVTLNPWPDPVFVKGSKFYEATKEGLTLTLSAEAHEPPEGVESEKALLNHQLSRAILWVNDHQFQTWSEDDPAFKNGRTFKTVVTIPQNKLRNGKNVLLLQVYNHGEIEAGKKPAGGPADGTIRGESEPILVLNERPTPKRTLHGLLIGVGDYRMSQPRQQDLTANREVKYLYESLWSKHPKGYYSNINVLPPLVDAKATPDKIVKQLEKLAQEVQPDDVLVLHIGGHGALAEEIQHSIKDRINHLHVAKSLALEEANAQKRQLTTKRVEKQLQEELQNAKNIEGLRGFLFCCSNFDLANIRQTTLNFSDLYNALVKIPCRKLVLLDTCHSGAVPRQETENNLIRSLMPDGVGPIVFSACQPHEVAYEHSFVDENLYSLFTAALRISLQESFAQADKNGNRFLEPEELFRRIEVEVQELRELTGLSQRPAMFIPELERGFKLVQQPNQ